MSIEKTYRATGRNILKEIRSGNFEKMILEKGSLVHTNDYIETGIQVRDPLYPSWEVFKGVKLGEYRGRVQSN